MKKSVKIISLSEYHSGNDTAKPPVTTPRKALVQGTLDIVSPRSPVQSLESSAARSSSSSVVSSRHSYVEDPATPRRMRPAPPSMSEAPQPERPSTSLELSDDDTEVPNVRPFSDASNVPRGTTQTLKVTENVELDKDIIDEEEPLPFSIPHSEAVSALSEEENRSTNQSEVPFKLPHSMRNQSTQNSISSESGSKAQSTSNVTGSSKKKKKGRMVESRYLKADNQKLSASSSASFSVSAMGRPLFNSTSLDSSHLVSRNTLQTEQPPTQRPRKPGMEPKPKRAVPKPKKTPSVVAPRVESTPIPSSAAAPDSSVTVASQRDLDLLYTVYMQCKYLDAATADHERRQRQQFEAEYATVLDAVRDRQVKLTQLEQELHYWRFVRGLEDAISDQIAVLEPLLEAFPDFSRRFSTVCTALDSTRHRIELRDLVVPSADQLRQWQLTLSTAAEKAAHLLEEVVSDSPMSADRIERLAELLAKLREDKMQHQQLFETARDLLGRAEHLFSEEASLRVHEHQQEQQ